MPERNKTPFWLDPMPLLSLAMATRNAARFLPAALASVPSPPVGWNLEIVLADGGSTDTTLALAAADPRVRIVSTHDSGLYDGMNIAIGAVRGDWTLVLNSDDALLGHPLEAALRFIGSRPDIDHLSGGALFGTEPAYAMVRRHTDRLSAEGALFGIPAINARLLRSSLIRQIGPIRTDLGLGADREWMVRLASSGARGANFADAFYFYRSHEGSQTMAGGIKGRRRVYRAEAQLAAGLLADSLPNNQKEIAKATYALARFKLMLSGGTLGIAKPPPKMSISLADLRRGIVLARHWRGRLSGY
jgi:glycosyltransferase involved in cell wall biosynthesis